MDLLLSGHPYDEPPKAYVIFICDFDPFGLQKYCYTFENRCLENYELSLNDGCQSIFLSTKGNNPDEISEEMVAFLTFVREDTAEAETSSEDAFVRELKETIRNVKQNRDMERQYMLIEDLLREEAVKAKSDTLKECILELIEAEDIINEALQNRIMSETNITKLKSMYRAAIRAKSLEQFQEMIANL